MILQVFSIRDRAAETFGRPMFVPAKGQAIRAFSDEINRPATDNQFYQHPDDFDLYHVGIFDDSSGLLIANEGGVSMVSIGKDVAIRDLGKLDSKY